MIVLRLIMFVFGLLVFVPTMTAIFNIVFARHIPHTAKGTLLERFGKYWVASFCLLISFGTWYIDPNAEAEDDVR